MTRVRTDRKYNAELPTTTSTGEKNLNITPETSIKEIQNIHHDRKAVKIRGTLTAEQLANIPKHVINVGFAATDSESILQQMPHLPPSVISLAFNSPVPISKILSALPKKISWLAYSFPISSDLIPSLIQDIPPQIEAVKKELPSIEVELLPPIGEHPKFIKLISQIAVESASQHQEVR